MISKDGFHPRSFIPNLNMVICKRNISWGNDLRRNAIPSGYVKIAIENGDL